MANTDQLGLGLDDIIRLNRTNRRGGAGGGNRGFRGRGGRGGNTAFRNRGGAGGFPRSSNGMGGGRWRNDLFTENADQPRGGQRSAGVNSTTKLLISNLDLGVTSKDIQELFEDVGAVRSAHVHYDEDGQSLGTAEVLYERRVDAVAAQQKYNTLNLDGRPMDIRLLGNIDGGFQSNRFTSAGGNNRRNQQGGGFRNNNNQRNNNSNNFGRNERVRGGNPQRGANKAAKEEVTAEDLDADLENYRAEMKQKK